MKILRGGPDRGRIMTKNEVNQFLQDKRNMQIATVDEGGDPIIQPVWFVQDQQAQKIYFNTGRESKKMDNRRRRQRIYFSVDVEEYPYKCVKGKADATILEDPQRNAAIVEKITAKYLGTQDHPLAKTLVEMAENRQAVVLELTPKYYTTQDFSASQMES